MFPSTEPAAVRIAREFREAVNATMDAQMFELGQRWLEIEYALESKIDALILEIQGMVKDGKEPSKAMITRLQRYRELRNQTHDEILRYENYIERIISDGQRKLAIQGLDVGRETIMALYQDAGIMGSFNILNVGAIETMVGYLGSGAPLNSLLQEAFPFAWKGMTDKLVEGIALGLSPRETARKMYAGMSEGFNRLLTISRTEQLRAYRQATVMQYRESGVVKGFRRLVAKQGACMACLVSDGEFYEVAEDFSDHPNGRAEIPGNVILSESPTSLKTLNYNGDIIVISTASGNFLAVTPNHPVLTDSGWVPAKFIQEGDNVLNDGLGDWASDIVSPYKNQVPTLVENMASAFDMLRLGRVPKSAKNLYGKGMDGEIDVVFINSLLWSGYNTSERKHIIDDLFGCGHPGHSFFTSLSDFTAMFKRLFFSTSPFLSPQNYASLFTLSHIGSPQSIGFNDRSLVDFMLGEYACGDRPGKSKRSGNGFFGLSREIPQNNFGFRDHSLSDGGYFSSLNFRSFGFTPKEPVRLEIIRESLVRNVPSPGSVCNTFAGQVIFDRVMQVGIRSFSGHVYSLQTPSEYYSSNHIISHNCSLIAVLNGVPEREWLYGEDWFRSLGEDQQKEIMGSQYFQAWQGGAFELSELRSTAHSDIWGDSPKVTPLKELLGVD